MKAGDTVRLKYEVLSATIGVSGYQVIPAGTVVTIHSVRSHDCEFLYRDRYFAVSQSAIELLVKDVPLCMCSVNTLMSEGCKCGGN
jgi:hypothetical protein